MIQVSRAALAPGLFSVEVRVLTGVSKNRFDSSLCLLSPYPPRRRGRNLGKEGNGRIKFLDNHSRLGQRQTVAGNGYWFAAGPARIGQALSRQRMLNALTSHRHSCFTRSRPRNRNCRAPKFCLMNANGLSDA